MLNFLNLHLSNFHGMIIPLGPEIPNVLSTKLFIRKGGSINGSSKLCYLEDRLNQK